MHSPFLPTPEAPDPPCAGLFDPSPSASAAGRCGRHRHAPPERGVRQCRPSRSRYSHSGFHHARPSPPPSRTPRTGCASAAQTAPAWPSAPSLPRIGAIPKTCFGKPRCRVQARAARSSSASACSSPASPATEMAHQARACRNSSAISSASIARMGAFYGPALSPRPSPKTTLAAS